jgi:hypothetical protein
MANTVRVYVRRENGSRVQLFTSSMQICGLSKSQMANCKDGKGICEMVWGNRKKDYQIFDMWRIPSEQKINNENTIEFI